MTKIDAKRVGRRMRLVRQTHDRSTARCAKACGKSKASWSDYKKGLRLVPAGFL
jgi:hypothetical protein